MGAPTPKRSITSPHIQFALLLGMGGSIILAIGGMQAVRLPQTGILWLLAGLSLASSFAATIYSTNRSNVGFNVGTAVSFAAIPGLGAGIAALIVAFEYLGVQFMRHWRPQKSKAGWEQIVFNVGMMTISMYAAGRFYEYASANFSMDVAWVAICVWAAAVLIHSQVNLWLLTLLLMLWRGEEFRAGAFWLDNRWAMLMDVAIIFFGGGILAIAAARYDSIGIAIFFLPIALSALVFRLYVQSLERQMIILEQTVAQRTTDLETANRELQSYNDSLTRLNGELEEADRARNRFLAVLTHDMRSPLTGILLYGQMLQRGILDNSAEKRARMTEVVLQNANTLLELVDNVVEIERLKSEEIAPKYEYFDLTGVLESSVSQFEPQAMKKEIDLIADFPPIPLIIQGDPQLMRRVVGNLVSNAIKYTPHGGQVTIATTSTPDTIRFSVTDTGEGIPTAELNTIFAPYHRMENHRGKAKGLGLGLSIVKHYVEAHNGEIMVSSKVGEGSCFEVCIPSPTT